MWDRYIQFVEDVVVNDNKSKSPTQQDLQELLKSYYKDRKALDESAPIDTIGFDIMKASTLSSTILGEEINACKSGYSGHASARLRETIRLINLTLENTDLQDTRSMASCIKEIKQPILEIDFLGSFLRNQEKIADYSSVVDTFMESINNFVRELIKEIESSLITGQQLRHDLTSLSLTDAKKALEVSCIEIHQYFDKLEGEGLQHIDGNNYEAPHTPSKSSKQLVFGDFMPL
jgi:hypothetical protein